MAHILQPDGQEHGGAVLCGFSDGFGRPRLLARNFQAAVDGQDYVQGRRGHRALTPSFIRRMLRLADDQQLICLFIHGHGDGNSVAFSPIDLASHERGYPALLDITSQTVGALVLASHAVAGDIWMATGGRADVETTVVIGTNIRRLTPTPTLAAAHRDEDDRQARLFGDRGLQILREARVGVVGVGGAGMLAVELLTRLGVGELIVIDPERVELTNLPRLPGATRRDARSFLTSTAMPTWLQAIGRRMAMHKVRIAHRLAKQSGRRTSVTAFATDVSDRQAAASLTACDFIVLAADTATARHLSNIISYQYLVPLIQVGVKIPVGGTGTVGDVFAAVRPVLPDGGCLRCAGLIDSSELAREALPAEQRRLADYGTGEPAPSVITLNSTAVSAAMTHLLFSMTGLHDYEDIFHVRHHPRHGGHVLGEVRRDAQCPVCGTDGVTGLGNLRELPLPR